MDAPQENRCGTLTQAEIDPPIRPSEAQPCTVKKTAGLIAARESGRVRRGEIGRHE